MKNKEVKKEMQQHQEKVKKTKRPKKDKIKQLKVKKSLLMERNRKTVLQKY